MSKIQLFVSLANEATKESEKQGVNVPQLPDHGGESTKRVGRLSSLVIDSKTSFIYAPISSFRFPHQIPISPTMEFFVNAKVVRLRSHHDKYLVADDDQESVFQERNGTTKNARWTVEFVDGIDMVIRLCSCYGKHLTATNSKLPLGVTGKKVVQSTPRRLDSSVEWEPIREGTHVKLKTRYGNFLRANAGVPPWRNSVTHDIPHRSSHQDWLWWDVEVVQVLPTPKLPPAEPTLPAISPGLSKLESSDSIVISPPKSEGRTIYYHIADDKGNVDDATEGAMFLFKGNGVEELAQKLVEETGIEQDIIVCTRSPLNGNIYPLRLHLPPNNATMHIIVVNSKSKAARNFEKSGLL